MGRKRKVPAEADLAFWCDCGRGFTTRSGLAIHKKHCSFEPQDNPFEGADDYWIHHEVQEPEIQEPEEVQEQGARLVTFELKSLEQNLDRIFPTFESGPKEEAQKEIAENPLKRGRRDNPHFPFKSKEDKAAASFALDAKMTIPIANRYFSELRDVHKSPITLRSWDDVDENLKLLDPESFTKIDLTEEFPDFDGPLHFSYKDGWDGVKELFANPRFAPKMKYFYERKVKDGEEVFGSLENGLWWKQKQSLVPEGSVIAPVILYSDQTTAQNIGSVSVYPVYMTIGNIGKADRRKDDSYLLVGYLPLVDTPGLKLKVLHRCLEILLQGIKERGISGSKICDGDGKERVVYPYFAYFIGDWPECKRITLTRDSKKTAEPCHACRVPKEQLGEISNEIRALPMKSLEEVQRIVAEARQHRTSGKKKDAEELLKKNSLQLHENAFWSMPGANILVQTAPDLIHQLFLGLAKALLEAILNEIGDDRKLLHRFDHLFATSPRWKDLQHFNKGVSDLNFVKGKEMKSMLFHFPFILHSLKLSKPLFHLSESLLKWYLAITHGEYTISSLESIQEIENELGKWIVKGNLESHFETVKNHTMIHYTPFIALFESPDEFSTQAGEHHHIAKVKNHYRRSNRRNPETFMLKLEARHLAMKKVTFTPPSPKEILRKAHRPSGRRLKIKKIHSFAQDQPPFREFPRYLVVRLDAVRKGWENDIRDMRINVYGAINLNCNGVLRRVHALESYQGRKKQDTVSVNAASGERWFAKLLMVFETSTEEHTYESAFVQWYMQANKKDVPFLRLELQDRFQVIDLISIVAPVQIFPDPNNPRFVFVHSLCEEYQARKEARAYFD